MRRYLFVLATVATLLSGLPASAQNKSGIPDERVLTGFGADEMQSLVTDLGGEVLGVKTNGTGGPLIEAKLQGYNFSLSGVYCADGEQTGCTGLQMASVVVSSAPDIAILRMDHRYVFLSVGKDERYPDKYHVTRYEIFDGGQTYANMKLSLSVYSNLLKKVIETMPDVAAEAAPTPAEPER